MVPESIEKPFVSIFLGFNANLIRLGGSIYEKNPPNPKKIDTKGFSIVFGTFRHAK